MKNVLFLVFGLIACTLQAQKIPVITEENAYLYAVIEMGETGLTFICDDEHHMMHVVKNEEDTAYLIYSEEMGILYWEDPDESESYYSGDTIVLATNKDMSASSAIWYFQWDGKEIIELDGEFFNANEGIVEHADSLLEVGLIMECVYTLHGVQYPHSEFDTWQYGLNIMEKAHSLALEQYNIKNYDSASGIMNAAFEYWENGIMLGFTSQQDFLETREDGYNVWDDDQLKLWIGDYGLFLCLAKKYEASVEINSYLNTIFPQAAGPYLQLGDTYYEMGKSDEAKTTYKKYVDLKKKQNSEKDIPSRVKERIK